MRDASESDRFAESIAISRDGKKLVCAFTEALALFDTTTGKQLWSIQTPGTWFPGMVPAQVAMNSDGTLIALAGVGPSVLLYDGHTEHPVGGLEHPQPAVAVAFSPSGQSIVTADRTGTICHWTDPDFNLNRILHVPIEKISSVAYSPRGDKIVFGSEGGRIGIWDLRVGDTVAQWFDGNTAIVMQVSMATCGNSGRKLIASCASDGTVRIWDGVVGREIVQLLGVGAEDFITFTPDGYYEASRGGFTAVAFRVGMEALPVQQFDILRDRPDIIVHRLNVAARSTVALYDLAYQKRINFLRANGVIISPAGKNTSLKRDMRLPTVAITNAAQIQPYSQNRSVTLHILAKGVAYPLARVLTMVNGVPLGKRWGSGIAAPQPFTYDREVTVPLSQGENKIEISVSDTSGKESLPAQLLVMCVPNEQRSQVTNSSANSHQAITLPKRRLYFVAIGVSNYPDSRYDLLYSASDARKLIRFFTRNQAKYGPLSTLCLVDAHAKKRDIQDNVRKFLSKATVDDTIVLLLSGHGLFWPKTLTYYFGTWDIDFSQPHINGLSFDEVEDLMDDLRPRKKLLLIDTCKAGNVDTTSTAKPQPKQARGRGYDTPSKDQAQSHGTAMPVQKRVRQRVAGPPTSRVPTPQFLLMEQIFPDLIRSTGTGVIASVEGTEPANEAQPLDGGVFTKAVLEAMAQQNVTVSSLWKYVSVRVPDLAQQKLHLLQTPTLRRDNLDMDWSLTAKEVPAQF